MEKLWTRARDMAGAPSVLGGRLLAELGRISSVMKRALGAYETRGLGGRSSSQVHQANASAAPLSALETHVSLVGHKDLPAEAYRQLRRPQGRPRGHRERSPGSLTITSRNGHTAAASRRMARRAGHRPGCGLSRSLTNVGSVILAQFH